MIRWKGCGVKGLVTLFRILFRHFPGASKKSTKSQPGQQISVPRFEPMTSWIRSRIATCSRATFSENSHCGIWEHRLSRGWSNKVGGLGDGFYVPPPINSLFREPLTSLSPHPLLRTSERDFRRILHDRNEPRKGCNWKKPRRSIEWRNWFSIKGAGISFFKLSSTERTSFKHKWHKMFSFLTVLSPSTLLVP